MTGDEFISEIKEKGGIILPAVAERALQLTQSAMQQMRSAMMPPALLDFYKNVGGGVIMGDAEILGPTEFDRPKNSYIIPSIIEINRDISSLSSMRGRAVFGRNGLFWFGFDAFGNFYMLDILNLSILRKYDNLYKAMFDCLIVGKI